MQIAGFPYQTVQFDRRGAPVARAEVQAAQDQVLAHDLSDLLVLVHGWNSTIDSALERYTHFLKVARPLLDGELRPGFQGRRLGVVGIVWPSMRFADALQIPGGAASADLRPLLKEELEAAQALFADAPDSPIPAALEELRRNLAVLEDRGSVRRSFLKAIQAQLHASATQHQEPGIPDKNLKDSRVKDRLSTPVRGVVAGDVQGHAAGTLFNGPLQVFRNLLNLTTYYEMKDRAGQIGQTGARGLLRDLRAVRPTLRLHLIGHSFGGRLISAAARGPDGDPPLPIDSLHLLQAAFSHYGFGEARPPAPEGYFRPVVTQARISGPLLVTHTKNDLAVGLAYAVASALAGQNASAIGDRSDLYGAIGSNGALNAGAVEMTLGNDTPLDFRPGRIYNLHADMIPNHGDVEQPGVVRAVLHGVLAG
ncbi:alpha/beta fold hydrolase [Deinococcus koreensis]|uniref:Serine-threonine protein kinase n=1 Tax=Deinococcus koreensis TaxID=2054903 RepID=A0A2K3UWN7_9DEIO|nr:hypothetical protein [Deinococcus koreensis]PNY80949.1 hypothetical protein CVO96_05795 [Deinococcus koreensis]